MKKQKLPIVEIFNSIQGEGANSGMYATFIRLAGCNLSCAFCDTDYEVKKEMTIRKIVDWPYMLKNVVITGGEPMIHDIRPLVDVLKFDHQVYIETNGTIHVPFYPFDAWITVSPKDLDFVQKSGNELKVLWFGKHFIDAIDKMLFMYFNHRYIQPIEKDGKFLLVDEILQYIERNPEWRLSMQIHKILHLK